MSFNMSQFSISVMSSQFDFIKAEGRPLLHKCYWRSDWVLSHFHLRRVVVGVCMYSYMIFTLLHFPRNYAKIRQNAGCVFLSIQHPSRDIQPTTEESNANSQTRSSVSTFYFQTRRRVFRMVVLASLWGKE